ncbi:MAG: hypothetical protein KGL53_08475, partial [Elusimicrobia bacterium]|nr:hypothetical protein [Elusimicrobiota bacterium]
CAAASLLTPYGTSLYPVLLAHLVHPPAAAGVEEWLGEGLRYYPAFWLLLPAFGARLAADLARGRRAALSWACLLAPLALMGLLGARFAVLFCLAAPVYVLSGLENLLRPRWMDAGLAAACLAMAAGMTPSLLNRRWSRPVLWDRTPRAAVGFLDAHRVSGTLFNDYSFGGYLDWAGGRPVYYDGRYLFQGLLAEAQKAARTPEGFQALLTERGVDYALVPFPKGSVEAPGGLPRSPWALRFPKAGWALVHADDAALVYAKREPRFAGLIAAEELRYADPSDPDFVLSQVRAGRWSRAEVLNELGRRGNEFPAAAQVLRDVLR